MKKKLLKKCLHMKAEDLKGEVMAEPWESVPGIILGAIVVILIFGWGAYLDHKKHMREMERKMDLIEKGLWKPEYEAWKLEKVSLFVGLVVLAVGIAFLSGSFFLPSEGLEWGRFAMTFVGTVVSGVGIAFIIYHALTRKESVQVSKY
jgi:hypothetical protein